MASRYVVGIDLGTTNSALAYFDTNRASNGPTEAVNLLVEKIRRIGHGYRRFDHYRLRLLLHCGIEWPNILPPRIRRRRPRFVA